MCKPALTSKTFDDEHAYSMFAALQGQGLRADEAAKLAFDNWEDVISRLEKGEALQGILQQAGMSLADHEQFKAIEKRLESVSVSRFFAKNAYSLGLLAGAFFLSRFFISSVMPAMDSFLEGESYPLLFELISLILAAGLASICLVSLFHHLPAGRRLSWNQKKRAVWAALALSLCTDISTLEAMNRLEGVCPGFMKQSIEEMRKRLEAGDNLEAALSISDLDGRLAKFAACGLACSRLGPCLDIYADNTLSKMEEQAKQFGRWITFSSYLAVGLLAMLVYQVLLSPMNLLYAL